MTERSIARATASVDTDQLSGRDRVVETESAPWPAFAMAAKAAVKQLHRQIPMTLWLVVAAGGTREQIVTAAGLWSDPRSLRAVAPALPSFCEVVRKHGGTLAASSVDNIADVDLGHGLADARSFIAVPLLAAVEEPFGALCGFDCDPGSDRFALSVELATFVGRMLSTLLVAESNLRRQVAEVEEAMSAATTDELTGVLNRRGWQEALHREHTHGGGREVSLLVLDLDHLKSTNDNEGHAAGDARLRRLATVLTHACRPHDRVARVGGDEFAILSPDCSDLDVLGLKARFDRALRASDVDVSIGCATRRPDEDLHNTWHRADVKMLRAKNLDDESRERP